MIDIRPNMVDGDPVCAGRDCPMYLDTECSLADRGPTWSPNPIGRGQPCIPGLRAQRYELEAENAQLKSWLSAESCTDLMCPRRQLLEARAALYKHTRQIRGNRLVPTETP